MDLSQFLLFIHIAGAIGIGISTVYAFFAVLRHKSYLYKPLALTIAFGTGFQLITGSFLVILSSNQTLFSFCSKIGFYLSLVLFIEILLFKNMQRENQQYFPIKTVASSLAFGIVFVFLAVLNYSL